MVSDCPSVGVMTVTMLTECANVSDSDMSLALYPWYLVFSCH